MFKIIICEKKKYSQESFQVYDTVKETHVDSVRIGI